MEPTHGTDGWIKWLVGGFARIFEQNGYTQIKMCIAPDRVFFVHDDRHLPYPRIGFMSVLDPDERAGILAKEYERLRHEQMTTDTGRMSMLLSAAHSMRNGYERSPDENEHALMNQADAYSQAILSSGDESGLKMVRAILRRPDVFTLCSTDDAQTGLVPEEIRTAVAEALAGLAMVAVHRDQMYLAVGFAMAALFKHGSALPFINCARIAALVRPRNIHTVLYLTRFVMLPYFRRTKDQESYDWELDVWGPEFKELLCDVPVELFGESGVLGGRPGHKGVVKGVFRNAQIVRKICAVCGKGTQDHEKVKACGRCGMVYYCGRQCQAEHWKQHKGECHSITTNTPPA